MNENDAYVVLALIKDLNEELNHINELLENVQLYLERIKEENDCK